MHIALLFFIQISDRCIWLSGVIHKVGARVYLVSLENHCPLAYVWLESTSESVKSTKPLFSAH